MWGATIHSWTSTFSSVYTIQRTQACSYRVQGAVAPILVLPNKPLPCVQVTPTVSLVPLTYCSLNCHLFWFRNFRWTFWFPQKEPKWLLPDILPYLKIYHNAAAARALPCTPLGKLTALADLAGVGGHFLVERGKGVEGWKREVTEVSSGIDPRKGGLSVPSLK